MSCLLAHRLQRLPLLKMVKNCECGGVVWLQKLGLWTLERFLQCTGIYRPSLLLGICSPQPSPNVLTPPWLEFRLFWKAEVWSRFTIPTVAARKHQPWRKVFGHALWHSELCFSFLCVCMHFCLIDILEICSCIVPLAAGSWMLKTGCLLTETETNIHFFKNVFQLIS